MKKQIIRYISLILIVIFGIFMSACVDNKHISEKELLRFHIRADGNDELSQRVKLKVRDDVVAYLEKQNENVKTFDEAFDRISSVLGTLKKIADSRLHAEGMTYESKVSIRNEYFPTRAYGDFVLGSGYYDALIIELGSGKGDNWWCVIYPPLCYLEATGDFNYKSKIKELIDKYF